MDAVEQPSWIGDMFDNISCQNYIEFRSQRFNLLQRLDVPDNDIGGQVAFAQSRDYVRRVVYTDYTRHLRQPPVQSLRETQHALFTREIRQAHTAQMQHPLAAAEL